MTCLRSRTRVPDWPCGKGFFCDEVPNLILHTDNSAEEKKPSKFHDVNLARNLLEIVLLRRLRLTVELTMSPE